MGYWSKYWKFIKGLLLSYNVGVRGVMVVIIIIRGEIMKKVVGVVR